MIGGSTDCDMAIGISGCFTIAIAFGGIGIDGKALAFTIGIYTNPIATGFVAATLIAFAGGGLIHHVAFDVVVQVAINV